MLGDRLKTYGISLLLHGAILGVLVIFAAPQVLESIPEEIEIEIVAPPPKVPTVLDVTPEPVPEPVPEPEPKSIPRKKRPTVVPKEVKMVKVEKAQPFQENAPTTDGDREAPDDVEAVPTPTVPVIDMGATVGTGVSDYVSAAGAPDGTVAVRAGPGGGRGGSGIGSGVPGALANQDAVGIKVSRDWQITRMPRALNHNDFEPVYPPVAKREGREAVIIMRLYIDEGGRVRQAEWVEGPRGHGFIESALAYGKRLRFQPAVAGTNPVASRIDWTVYFYVRN